VPGRQKHDYFTFSGMKVKKIQFCKSFLISAPLRRLGLINRIRSARHEILIRRIRSSDRWIVRSGADTSAPRRALV